MNLAHESDYNDAQQQYDLFIGLNGMPPLDEEVSLYLSSKNLSLWGLIPHCLTTEAVSHGLREADSRETFVV